MELKLSQLKSIFPSLVILGQDTSVNYEDYLWFETENGATIGVKKSELTDKDYAILTTFLNKTHLTQRPLKEREKMWHRILFHNEPYTGEPITYRYVFFKAQKGITDPEVFDEAIQAVFPIPMAILWFNQQEGVIIEELRDSIEQSVRFDEIVDVIMSDLYVKVSFFVGEQNEDASRAAEQFKWYQELAETSFHLSNKEVVYLKDMIPRFLVKSLNENLNEHIVSSLLKSTIQDEELLKTIKSFLENNLNASETAKKLYMHRNSLQYRIDKFIEITGIDIRTFNGAVIIYLLLQMLERRTD